MGSVLCCHDNANDVDNEMITDCKCRVMPLLVPRTGRFAITLLDRSSEWVSEQFLNRELHGDKPHPHPSPLFLSPSPPQPHKLFPHPHPIPTVLSLALHPHPQNRSSNVYDAISHCTTQIMFHLSFSYFCKPQNKQSRLELDKSFQSMEKQQSINWRSRQLRTSFFKGVPSQWKRPAICNTAGTTVATVPIPTEVP